MLAHMLIDAVVSLRRGKLQPIPQPDDNLPRRVARPFQCRCQVSTSRIPNLFPQDEKELETPEEEVEAPRPVLPHGRSGSIVVADQHDRVDEVKALRQDAQKAKAHWSI